MRRYIQPGNSLQLTAPVGNVVGGQGYLIGSLFVVANHDATAGARFEGLVEGVADIAKAAGEVWTEGQIIFWDNAARRATTTATGNTKIGAAAAAAASADTFGRVRLNGVV
jgi:predicted RecA/RadA family phage recombinase